ncbi:hypothetical protein BBO99_00001637 [Phytophthora kernoviae]|uniref:CENP-V/GFA domain-containing protein n=2 Tax=Phytophthora kernoviae TaxID=325452 RepID=A0A421GYZ6_9STRA|nr:hypothetical protein G195_002218 [Phytophthora kernoviae 00238/432]KAG2531260.1 hypothetical protein JM16_001181 [Phytophthora kernoviae]KAG2531889.1 hypothetical protein JM18_001554 [Phytophthora kernoviae]RLN45649.1 hypothetical protein BBI17_001407 [Phytophthora kernoviae]RLN84021.1 hypothetical protein BBO99_00001637 [Phytophthora kernoviae]
MTKPNPSKPFVLHQGSCHCKAVQFEFDAPSDIVQTKCNCSICRMKGNVHTIVPKSRFRLLQGQDMLTLYMFNTHTAHHLFCKRCGVQSFYSPRNTMYLEARFFRNHSITLSEGVGVLGALDAVQFEFEAPSDLVQTECNCSICTMKGNIHTIVHKSHFKMLQGEDILTLYTFHTHKSQHLFCKRCGVQAFFIPRLDPDAYAVTVACVDPETITSVKTETFDGKNWD